MTLNIAPRTVIVRGKETDDPDNRVISGTVEYNKVTLDVPAIIVPATFAAATQYMLNYGFAQSLQDSVSGMSKELGDAAFAAAKGDDEGIDSDLWPEGFEFGEPDDYRPNAKGDRTVLPANVKAQIDEIVANTMRERAAAILAGNVTARGPRLPTVDRLVRTMALDYLKAFAKKKGTKLPKKPKDAKKGSPNVALNAMIDAAIASPLGAKWRAEAQKQIDALAALDTEAGGFDPFAPPVPAQEQPAA